ncbi:MAG: hypothetical protein ACSHXG_11285 [Maribacter stanieri]|uniref:hypothetical protein n=1 Tax=Maribacter stanieri TaxID=440514 RepID=UPI0030DC8960|tara:strand:- start:198 stop:596 length:399 start_codon:yes stop_codon:yes gene_type:complete
MKIYTSACVVAIILMVSCSATNTSKSDNTSLDTELREKNRANLSLLQRIRQKPGVILQNNVPVLNKTTNSFDSGGNQEPLYVLNNQVIGNSFNSVNELIDSYNVKKIIILSGADAASYGTQGSNGVIKITSY